MVIDRELKIIQDIVDTITYKPGFELKVLYSSDARFVEIRCMQNGVPDSNDPTSKLGPLLSRICIDPYSSRIQNCSDKMKKKHIIEEIAHTVKRMELHEVEEWFRVDGKRLYNPHPDQNPNEILWSPE